MTRRPCDPNLITYRATRHAVRRAATPTQPGGTYMNGVIQITLGVNDRFVNGELLAAAMCYIAASEPVNLDPAGEFIHRMWPFAPEFCPDAENPVKNMEIARNLLALAIESEESAHRITP